MVKPVSPKVADRTFPRVGAIVLAAGGSTRMRQPKQLMSVEGAPLIVRTANAALASTAWPVVVVIGSAGEAVRPLLAKLPLLLVENPDWQKGIGSSLRVGLEALEQFSTALDGVLLALGDQPHLSAEAIHRLIARLKDRSGICAARYAGVIGAPALFGRDHFAELLALPDDLGAQRVLRAHAKTVVAVDLPEFATDLDTPEDYQRFVEQQKARTLR